MIGAHDELLSTSTTLPAKQQPALKIAPRLAKSQVSLITGMLSSEMFTNSNIATAANCSIRGVQKIHLNIRYYGALQAPRNSGERKRSITLAILDALCEHLEEKPRLY